MDAQAKRKALFRAKLSAQKQEKQRIDSPLVRYNELEQPICRVCEVVIKSDSLWPAHQASRKHHEAIEKLKANAAALNRSNNAKTESAKELKPSPEPSAQLHDKSGPSTELPTHRPPLPPNFFDNHDSKRQKNENDSGKSVVRDLQKKGQSSEKIQGMPASEGSAGSESKQVKGALPQGFFDDKDADLRARGITPVKPDVKDEYKEFEKLIQEDLLEIDDRLEEEEIDAAEMIEEAESVEQRSYRERVEILRKKKLDLRATRTVVGDKEAAVVTHKESSSDDDSSSDADDDSFKVDWRAKHL